MSNQTQSVKLLGRDPLLWSALASAVVTTLAVFHLGISAGAAGAISGVIVALVALYATRPRTPGLFTGLVAAAVALLAEYAIHLDDAQVMALNGIVLTAFALLTRQQVNPQETAISNS